MLGHSIDIADITIIDDDIISAVAPIMGMAMAVAADAKLTKTDAPTNADAASTAMNVAAPLPLNLGIWLS